MEWLRRQGISWSIGLQAGLYLLSGVNHFVHRASYLKIMPDHYGHPPSLAEGLVLFTGVAELAGGAGLLAPPTRRAAGDGIALMLVCFLDVHIFMLRHADRFASIPRWALWARLPLQAVLIWWVLRASHARRPRLG